MSHNNQESVRPSQPELTELEKQAIGGLVETVSHHLDQLSETTQIRALGVIEGSIMRRALVLDKSHADRDVLSELSSARSGVVLGELLVSEDRHGRPFELRRK